MKNKINVPEELPFRFSRDLVKIGNSIGVTIPKLWFRVMRKFDIETVDLEVYQDRIVITPAKLRR